MYIVCFYHANSSEIEEYQYSNLGDALSHYNHFAHDDSGLYRFVSLLSYINRSEFLVRLRSFPVYLSIEHLETKDDILEQKKHQLPGKQVIVFSMQGEPQIRPLLRGTIDFLDDQYQIHVRWENGSNLPVIIGVDDFEVLSN